MKKISITILVFVTFLLFGFILSSTQAEEVTICTLMWCEPLESSGAEEVACNHCSLTKPMFYTWVVNLSTECPAREILIFQDGEYVETSYTINEEECRIRINYFNKDFFR